MQDEQQKMVPQLVMRRNNLIMLPSIVLPEGYFIRDFKHGDECAWDNIIKDAFNSEISFEKTISSSKEFLPERVFFVCYNDVPIATATAWYDPKWGEETGYLHMVGVMKKHNGKGLGMQVSLAALHQMAKEKRQFAILHTDDHRIPAIKTYLKLDFKPVIVHENQVERWKTIINQLGLSNIQIINNL
ncbi:MAG: GNAT family N-acetyltransferase [Clostridiaceae bacterium]|jgi:mycothiol synthase|nr:GNAT family N-acetyltransferase [Clostridiaceae bacterium]